MERKLKTNLVWGHIDKTLGMFLIATRFKSCEDEWKIFKLMCNSQVEYPTEGIFDHPSFKKLVEKKKKVFLFESGEWNFDAIFSYLSDLEKEGVLYIGTPFELIKEILDKIPEDYLFEKYLSDGLRILDPACGRGRFLLYMKRRLLDIGLTEKEAIESLYGIDIDPKSALLTSALIDPEGLCEKSQIYYADTLNNFPKEIKDMKFDVIVGNPPYQHPEQPRHKLWVDFLIKAVDIGGIVAFVLPKLSLMMLNGVEVDQKKLSKCFVHWINMATVDKYFDVGSDFCAIIISKTIDKSYTEVVNVDGKAEKWNGNQLIPYTPNQKISSILSKTMSFTNEFNRSAARISESPNGKFKTISKLLKKGPVFGLSDKEHTDIIKPKILYATLGDANYVDYTGEIMPSTSFIMYITANSKKELGSLLSIKETKLFVFLAHAFSTMRSPIDFVWKSIKRIPLNKSWTDQEIYEYFNLTKEEIKLIEETIKD